MLTIQIYFLFFDNRWLEFVTSAVIGGVLFSIILFPFKEKIEAFFISRLGKRLDYFKLEIHVYEHLDFDAFDDSKTDKHYTIYLPVCEKTKSDNPYEYKNEIFEEVRKQYGNVHYNFDLNIEVESKQKISRYKWPWSNKEFDYEKN